MVQGYLERYQLISRNPYILFLLSESDIFERNERIYAIFWVFENKENDKFLSFRFYKKRTKISY